MRADKKYIADTMARGKTLKAMQPYLEAINMPPVAIRRLAVTFNK